MATKAQRSSEEGQWYLEGHDTFAGEDYPIRGRYQTEAKARAAAAKQKKELERTQPSSSSGGSGMFGIQDRIYVCGPGKRYQY